MCITPSHVHSMYSELDGFSTPEEIAARCVAIGAEACALTDHGVVAGHLSFDKAMRAAGVKPLFGCELYHGREENPKGRDQAHLIAIAQTPEGLRNLWSLVDFTADPKHYHYVGRVTREALKKYQKGIAFTSACPLGAVAKGLLIEDYDDLNWYLDNLDEFYLELTTYPHDVIFDGEVPATPEQINRRKVEIGLERGIGFMLGDDSHYASPDMFKMHNAYMAIQMRESVYMPVEERKMYHPPGALCMKDQDMTLAALSYLPKDIVLEAIENGNALGRKSTAELPGVKRHLPVFIPSKCPWLEKDEKGKNATELFIEKVERGLFERYGNPPQEVWDRALYEMEVLIDEGLEHYFLIGWDLVQFCHDKEIGMGPGRGSSAGSIVAYALGITDICPLRYGLIFERFWNPGRTDGFPDIDSDFPGGRRKEIKDYLTKRWGANRVKSIGNVGHMKPKAVVDFLARGFGISIPEAEEVKKILDGVIDIEIHGHKQIGWSREYEGDGKEHYVEEEVGEQLRKWAGSEGKRIAFLDMCKACCSRVEGYGVHASGVVISDVDLDNELPCYLRGPKNTKKEDKVPATQFPMDDVDLRKFLKWDVLGLETLDVLDEWSRIMKETHDVDIVWSELENRDQPEEMWDLLTQGFSAGIFQVEDGYAKRLARDLKPRNILDAAAIVALNRPGPIRAKVPERYIRRKHGLEPIEYDHPLLESILDETYGFFLYQEGVIKYFQTIGYTLGEADAVRKILGKKRPEKLRALYEGTDEWVGRAYPDMAAAAGISSAVAKKIWDDIYGFSSYSFNKSHSVAYGVLLFRTLYAKYYAPAEYYMACIRTIKREKKKKVLPRYMREARRLGIDVRPPDIRYSQEQISVGPDGNIYFGFSDVKGVKSQGKWFVRYRDENWDMSSPEAFVERLEKENTKFLESKQLALKEGRPHARFSPKQLLKENAIQNVFDIGAWDGIEPREITEAQKQQFELELLGAILSDSSTEILDRNDLGDCVSVNEVNEAVWEEDDLAFTVAGVITGIKPVHAKASGAAMGIVTLEDADDEVEFVVFPQQWKSHKFLWKEQLAAKMILRKTDRGINFEEGHILR